MIGSYSLTQLLMENAKIITMSDWSGHGSFSRAVSFKEAKGFKIPLEVTQEVYDDMLGAVPPQEYGKTRHEFIDLPLPVQNYFLVGEAYIFINNKPVYMAFARAYDTKYFYLGFMHAQPKSAVV